MIRFLIFSILVLFTLCCSPKKNNLAEISEETSETFDFPKDWLGTWSGELHIYTEKGLQQTIPMSINNQRTSHQDTFIWSITYGPDPEKGLRDYRLIAKNPERGHYQVDEQNGIILDSYMLGNKLMSSFEVMGNQLTSTYERKSDHILFEIMMMSAQRGVITGDTIIRNDTIPPVTSYPVRVSQIAKLYKKA